METFLATLQNENTRRAYRADLERFLAWCDEHGSKLGQFKPSNFLAYRDHLMARKISPAAVNRAIAAVRAYVRWCARHEMVPVDVYSAVSTIESVKIPQTVPDLLTDQEFADLLRVPDVNTQAGARDAALLMLLRYAGLRIGEAVALDIDMIRFDRDGGQAVVAGKGGKQRIVLFDLGTAGAIRRYLALRDNPASGALFVNENGARISDRWLRRQIAVYGERIGRPDLHPHLFRHTFATWLLDATGDMDAVQNLLGHANPATTKRYTRLATGRYRDVYNKALGKKEEGYA